MIKLPRVASDQWNAVQHISPEELQPGDLVFFQDTYMPGISHVGIYIGGNQQINAPAEGQVVSVEPVFDGYWGAHFAGAGGSEREPGGTRPAHLDQPAECRLGHADSPAGRVFLHGHRDYVNDTLHCVFDGIWGNSSNVLSQTDLAMTWDFGPVTIR